VASPHDNDGREDKTVTCPKDLEEAGEDTETRLHADLLPRQRLKSQYSPMLLVSGKLLLASLCSQAPTWTSTSGIYVRISDASSCVLGSVLWWLLASTFCFGERGPIWFLCASAD
jgi:hypothetical protein